MSELNLAINFAKEKFAFLTFCGYVLTEGDAPPSYYNYEKNYVLYYKSSDKLIELALRKTGDNVECVIRRKINEEFAPYNDPVNCLMGYKLMFLKNDFDYGSIKFSGYSIEERRRVIDTYAILLLDNKETICGDDWVDIQAIENNYRKYYQKKWGNEYETPKVTIMSLLTQATFFLLNTGYKVIEDTELLPPYQRLGWHIIYGDGTNIVKIHQADWRDFYYLFAITINNKKIFETQAADYKSLNDMAVDFVSVLKELTK
jgi:hypothetical protein